MFCQWLNTRPQRFLSELIVGDEATFRLDGHVCTNNFRRYADLNNKPRDFVYNVPNSKQKLTVWIGMIGNNTLIGPYFFPRNVTAAEYLNMIHQVVVPRSCMPGMAKEEMEVSEGFGGAKTVHLHIQLLLSGTGFVRYSQTASLVWDMAWNGHLVPLT